MKIFSKFQDYYDSAAAYGVDDHIKWVRNVDEHLVTEGTWNGDRILIPGTLVETDLFRSVPKVANYNYQRRDLESNWIHIGFCGKIYSTVRLRWYENGWTNEQVRYCYTADEIYDALSYCDEKVADMFFESKTKEYDWLGKPFTFRSADTWFKQWQGYEGYQDLFFNANVPIFSMDIASRMRSPIVMFTNPELKQYHFAKMVDPFTAYQEIEMFLGGVLGSGNPPMVEIDDKHIAEGKGFDKMSFRKYPTKNKKK